MIVQITINPKVALYLAEDGRVVDVKYLNEDAKNAFSDLEITGTKLEEAVRMIVDTSVKDGYLTEGKTISVDFVEATAEEATIETLAQNVQTAVRDTLAERKFSATLEIEVEGKVQDSVALELGTADKQDESGQQTANLSPSQPAKEPCPACRGTGICPECGGGTFPARDAMEVCGRTVVYAAAADDRPAKAVMALAKMPLMEAAADTVEAQEPIPVKCVTAQVVSPAASVTVRVLCLMTVSCVMVERLVLPVEEQGKRS